MICKHGAGAESGVIIRGPIAAFPNGGRSLVAHLRGYILLSVDFKKNSNQPAQKFELLPPLEQQQMQAKMPPMTAQQQQRINARPR